MTYGAFSLAVLLILMPRDAAAYIDPGSGSVLLQLLLGGVAGILVLLKLQYRRLAGFFRRRPADVAASPAERPDHQP